MLQRLSALVFVLAFTANTGVESRQTLGRGSVLPMDLTNRDNISPLKPGHGIVVNRDKNFGEKRRLLEEVPVGEYLQE